MNSHHDADGSALSHIGRKPKKCGICYRDFTRHFERHFKKMHPDDQLCVAQWVSGAKYVIVPLKEKQPASSIIMENQPDIFQESDHVLGKRRRPSSPSAAEKEQVKRPKVDEDPNR